MSSEDVDDEQWQPVAGIDEPAPFYEFTDVELLGEVTHETRGALLRRLREPRTVAEVADDLDVPVTRLYHHVNRLVDAGLIRVVATRQVAAVTERRYQVVARSLRLSRDLLETTDVRDLAVALGSLFDVAKVGFQRLVEAGEFAADVERDELAVLWMGELRLSEARRIELNRQLVDVVERFESDVPEGEDRDGVRQVTLFVSAYPEPS